jgi:hypothetical protein
MQMDEQKNVRDNLAWKVLRYFTLITILFINELSAYLIRKQFLWLSLSSASDYLHLQKDCPIYLSTSMSVGPYLLLMVDWD